ncbi:hypothetical protein [uncultured Jannaschia sp.]|uniref:hypothetical protein n=1 Tax=uncultured Jannaschia sp. TaxID=293347 RepID=UPI00261DFAD4|nr:hypothetical protein [uncultured Jannaschia sp.]
MSAYGVFQISGFDVTSTPSRSARRPATGPGLWATALGLCLLALVFRTGLLTSSAQFDELYHLLGARGWIETGRPAILDGEYTRTGWFTFAIAALFEATGRDSLLIGRLFSLPPGILAAPVLFVWLQARAGWAAGIGAGLLAVFWPQGIIEAQTLRFYSWHSFTFLLGAIAAFEAALATAPRTRLLWAAGAALCLAVAFYLQITTAIGLAGILVWLAGALLLPAILVRRHPRAILAGIALLGVALAALAQATGVLGTLWHTYRWTPLWLADKQNDVMFYHGVLVTMYPTLWPLFPLAAIVAMGRHARLASFCLVVFGAILVGQTFGGMKTERYLSYGMPFFFAVWGLAAAAIVPLLGRLAAGAAREVDPTRGRLVLPALVLAALFAALTNPFFERSIDALRGRTNSPLPDENWDGVAASLGDWSELPFRITMRELQTIAELGDYDLLYGPSRLTELPSQTSFAIDPRTGRPVIGETETLARVLDCVPEGLFLTSENSWFRQGAMQALGPVFAANGRAIETRFGDSVFALRWQGGGTGDPAACAALPI